MTRRTSERRFGDRERERLIKLFRSLGTDNANESEAARGRIDSLLREFGKTWSDLIQLFGGTMIHADLAGDIAARSAPTIPTSDLLLIAISRTCSHAFGRLGMISPTRWFHLRSGRAILRRTIHRASLICSASLFICLKTTWH